MGSYDFVGDFQIKCWKCEMKRLKLGNKVGRIDIYKNYYVLPREGGFIHVQNKKINYISTSRHKFDPRTFSEPVFNKWGDRILDKEQLNDIGVLEDYYYKSDYKEGVK